MSSTKQTVDVTKATRPVATRRRTRPVREKLKPDRVQEPLTVEGVEEQPQAEPAPERLKVTVTLSGRRRRGVVGKLTEAALDIAADLG